MADQQLTVFEAEFSLDNWRLEGQGIVEDLDGFHGSSVEAERAKDSARWKLAEWLLYGQQSLKVDGTLEAEAKKVNHRLSRRTVWVYIRTVKAFPESRRRDSLSWSHHKEIATSNFDADTRDRLLRDAEFLKFSVTQLRTAAKKEAGKGKPRKKA